MMEGKAGLRAQGVCRWRQGMLLALVMSSLFAAVFLGLGAQSAFAVTQGNSSFNTAKTISANTIYTEALTEYGPSNMGVRVYEDWYKVTLPQAGMFTLNLSAPYVSKSFANDPWSLELRSSANKKLWYGTRPNISGDYTALTMGLPAGTYYICLFSSSVPNVTYNLWTGYTASSDWELEPANDSRSTANVLTLGKTKFGSIYGCLDMGSNTDKDWYKVSISSTAAYDFRFGATTSSDVSNPWYLIGIYNGANDQLWSGTCNADGYERTIATLKLGAGTYYVKVSGANYMDGRYYVLNVKKAATKAANPMTVKGKTVSVKYKKLKKKSRKIAKAKAFQVSGAVGKVTFKKKSGNKKITVSSVGKITVKKGLKKGTYKVKVKVTARDDASYKKKTKTVTVKVKVK